MLKLPLEFEFYFYTSAECVIIMVLSAVELTGPPNAQCACSGDVLMFTCITMGEGSTIWGGSAFNDCPQNRIILSHSQLNLPRGHGECNNGEIMAKLLEVSGEFYTSQLNLTVSVSGGASNRTVECAHSGMPERKETAILKVISGELENSVFVLFKS